MAIRSTIKKHFEISENGEWNIPVMGFIQQVTKKYSGQKVTMSAELYEEMKSLPQLGYFFSTVLPWYIYGMILMGNELELGNKSDEEMIKDMLVSKHLDNGKEWKVKKYNQVIGPRVSGCYVKEIIDNGIVDNGS